MAPQRDIDFLTSIVTNYPWYRHERSLGRRTRANRPLLSVSVF
jgi:hypothetical protein